MPACLVPPGWSHWRTALRSRTSERTSYTKAKVEDQAQRVRFPSFGKQAIDLASGSLRQRAGLCIVQTPWSPICSFSTKANDPNAPAGKVLRENHFVSRLTELYVLLFI